MGVGSEVGVLGGSGGGGVAVGVAVSVTGVDVGKTEDAGGVDSLPAQPIITGANTKARARSCLSINIYYNNTTKL